MAASDKDRYGRVIVTPPRYSNCWVHALLMFLLCGGRLRLIWNGRVPHVAVDAEGWRYEFVYGAFGRNALFPLVFKGYGVKTPTLNELR
jgi:hypothetical protein